METHTVDKSRSRKSLSCLPCRKRKVKCDYRLPCGQCRLRGKSDLCAYEENNRWGYSGPQTSIIQPGPKSKLDACLATLKNENIFPGREDSNELFRVYKSMCHLMIPILDLDYMEKVYEQLVSQTQPSIEDTASLLILFAIAYRTHERPGNAVSADVPSKLGEMARQLIHLLDPLQIPTVKKFKPFFLYLVYVYWEDTQYFREASPLIGLLQGTLRGLSIFRKDKAINDLFSLVESCVALNMGLPSITKYNLIFTREDLFLKCRFALVKYRDRICSEIYAKDFEVEPKNMVSLEQEIKSAGGTFAVLQITHGMVTSLDRYQLLVINALCNQIGLFLYRPFLVTGHVQNNVETELWKRKALGMAVGAIQVALQYTSDFPGQFQFFSWNDIYLGAFQSALLLAHDHFARQKRFNFIPDTAKPCASLAIREPPLNTQIFQEIFMSGSTNWRYEIADRCRQMFLSQRSHSYCRSTKAASILSAFLNGATYMQVPELFGPFATLLVPPVNGGYSENGLITAKFNKHFFTNSISSRKDTEFEQLCNEAIYERILPENEL